MGREGGGVEQIDQPGVVVGLVLSQFIQDHAAFPLLGRVPALRHSQALHGRIEPVGAVAGLPDELQAAFRAQLIALPPDVEILSLRELAWPMAELQARHRAAGRPLSATMVEALAAAHTLHVGIAVSAGDVGPSLQAAAESDGIAFHVL